MTEMSHEITALFWVVAAALVAVVIAIIALLRSGHTVPPFAEIEPRHSRDKAAASGPFYGGGGHRR
jgi:hypothetical protein